MVGRWMGGEREVGRVWRLRNIFGSSLRLYVGIRIKKGRPPGYATTRPDTASLRLLEPSPLPYSN